MVNKYLRELERMDGSVTDVLSYTANRSLLEVLNTKDRY